MEERNRDLWTIDELGAQVILALSVDYAGQANGRVRDMPDPRTIRYYATLGLVDRQAAMRGRTALYGRRHLLQLVAIKRLQAQGNTLAELQRRLVGLTDSELARVARLPETADPQPVPERRDAAFWTRSPAPPEPSAPAGPAAGLALELLQGVTLASGVTLLLNSGRPLEPEDLEAIRTVAEPLLKLLDKRRLM